MKTGRRGAAPSAVEDTTPTVSASASRAPISVLRDVSRGGPVSAIVDEARYDVSTDEELIARHREGDAAAADALLSRYRNLARIKARSYFLVGADHDDILQEGMIGLYKAIRDFRADKETSFRVFADVCITRQLITAIRSARCQKHVPLNSYVSISKLTGEEGGDRTLMNALVGPGILDPAEVVIAAEELVSTRAALDELLSDFEVEVLRLYSEGKSYHEMAQLLEREVKSIDNALQRIKRKIELYLRNRGVDGPPAGPRRSAVHAATLPPRRLSPA